MARPLRWVQLGPARYSQAGITPPRPPIREDLSCAPASSCRMAGSIGHLMALPGNEFPFQITQYERASEPKERARHETNVHLLDLEDLPRRPDQIPDAALGPHEFRRDDHEQSH